jgi:hypothetical protein
MKKKFEKYLNFLFEEFGFPPNLPVQKPRPSRFKTAKQMKPRTIQINKVPLPPDQIKKKQIAKKKLPVVLQNNVNESNTKQYFNYMMWVSTIVKQGEVFKKKCYADNCDNFEIGTREKRLCKYRCKIESYRRVVQLLKKSVSKCKNSQNPQKCRSRYYSLIPQYELKINEMTKKYLDELKMKKERETNKRVSVG